MNYKRLNNITGWAVFAIAAFTYVSTVESTASLWDCSEFILSANKLEVGHPPGAPLFAMLGHLFTMFASPENAAYMANIFSALCSAFTILFLFWSITHLARRFVNKQAAELSVSELIMIMGSGIVGALACTFSDTFWFSAVEGEVYAASSFITAVVFWAILKWEEEADCAYSNRWLILIAYITGLSIGVHLLNLLVVPAIVFVYYFKKYEITTKGIIWTSVISVILLGVLVWGIIPQTPVIASKFELFFVNSLGLPINSGLLFFVAILTAALSYTIYYTYQKKRVVLNTVTLGLSFCLLGFGSYAMIVIRSSAGTPMNQNRPDNVFSLIKYINREQYGSAPLITGPYYTDADKYDVVTKSTYVRVGNKYVKEMASELKYQKTTLFPRMWSNRKESHTQIYKSYTKGASPTFSDNMRFFFDYQMGFMYWRYFMWNFAGRQNDMQGSKFDPIRGNWISGIKSVDESRLGSMDDRPKYLAENKGANKYYFIPLLLGLLGLLYQFRKDKKGFTIVTLLFFFTGIAIILYLNQAPDEPRERDYAYAGSFYAFTVWIGLGVVCVFRLLAKIVSNKIAAPVALLLGLPAPVIMAQQNWDDHDRTGRYIATDFGYNYLVSCDKNAILYTFGDIDTFTTWYNQEVEGVRRDIKIINFMYLESDWYYTQMMSRTYEAPPLITTATAQQITGETKFPAPIREIRPSLNLKQALQLFYSGKTVRKYSGYDIFEFPSKDLVLPVNTAKFIESGLIADTSAAVSNIHFRLSGNWVTRAKLGALDFAANNFNDRPIYYGGSDNDFFMGIQGHLRDEGVAKRLLPENTQKHPVDADKSFDLLVNKYRFRGLNDSTVFIDETSRQQMIPQYRNIFFSLADYLRQTGDSVRLKQLMEKYHEALPEMERGVSSAPYTMYAYSTNPAVENYFFSGLTEYGVSLAQRLMDEYEKEIKYFAQLFRKFGTNSFIERNMYYSYYGLNALSNILKKYNQQDLIQKAEDVLNEVKKIREIKEIMSVM
jgi:tetratricopeptide (TPR) repeat protein